MTQGVTKTQAKVFEYWKKQEKDTGLPPAIETATRVLQIGTRSRIQAILKTLEKKGLVKNVRRGIWVVV